MWPAWVLALLPWLREKAWPWILLHWKDAAVLLAILLGWLLARQSGKLKACEAALQVAPAGQVQALTGTAQAHVKVIYRPVAGKPCPEVEIQTDTDAAVAANQAQTAPKVPVCGPAGSVGGVWIGGEYLSTPQQGYGLATANLQAGPWQVGGGIGIGVWRAGVQARVLSW